MKTFIINLFLFTSFISFAQKKKIKNFMFNDHKIEYTRVDYSKYGIAHFIITMYDDNSKNEKIEKSSIRCLRREERLYHTLYFFLKIPSQIKSINEKNQLFSTFIKQLKKDEKIEKTNLYLNFDYDYSIPYQLNKEKNDKYIIKRIIVDIHEKQMYKALIGL